MAFFDFLRKEKRTPDPGPHPLRKEVLRILKNEGIEFDEDFLELVLKKIMVPIHFYRCNGTTEKCPTFMTYIGEGNPICPECGQSMEEHTIELPEGTMSSEDEDKIIVFADFQYALRKIEAGEIKTAIRFLTRVIEKDPEHLDAYYNRGEARIAIGDFTGAVEDCDKSISLNPEDADAYLNRGSAKANLKDYSSSLADTDNALCLGFSKLEIAYLNKAVCYLHLNNAQEAKEAFEKVIEVAPDSPQASTAGDALSSLFD